MRLAHYNFDKQLGISTVVLENRYGQYVGTAYLHEDDREYISEFAGLRLAENRATLNALKNELRRTKIKRQAIQSLLSDVIHTAEGRPIDDKAVTQRFDVHLNFYNKEIVRLTNEIEQLRKDILKSIKIRDELVKGSKETNKDE